MGADRAVNLIAKGRQLFAGTAVVAHGNSFGFLTEWALSSEELASEECAVYAEVAALYERCFPKAMMEHTRLKSALYIVAGLGKGSRPRLHLEFKKTLLTAAPEIVEALPDHKPAHFVSVGKTRIPQAVNFSPLLDKLISRDALSAFVFLSVA